MKKFDYDFGKAYQYLLDNLDRYGIEKVEGTGRFLKNGEPYNIVDDIKKIFENPDEQRA